MLKKVEKDHKDLQFCVSVWFKLKKSFCSLGKTIQMKTTEYGVEM